jgi:hypothetical protein
MTSNEYDIGIWMYVWKNAVICFRIILCVWACYNYEQSICCGNWKKNAFRNVWNRFHGTYNF